MTPDLMAQGAERYQKAQAKAAQPSESGGRAASYARLHQAGELDVAHGRILYLEDVHVSFDGFKAINGLSLDIAPGELRCIIGPNGAGKTTMMDIITGKTRPDAGRVFFGSTIDLLRHNEPGIAQLGIGRKFQKPTVFEQLSVFENLELALKTNKAVTASMVLEPAAKKTWGSPVAAPGTNRSRARVKNAVLACTALSADGSSKPTSFISAREY